MRLKCRSVSLVAAIFVLGSFSCRKDPGPQVGDLAPGFTLPDLEGQLHELADLSGRVVVLNYWATWCPPCVDEMPSLQKLHEALGAKGLSVVAVSVDERFEDIGRFVETFELTFTILHDPSGRIERRYQTLAVPESFLVGRDGVIYKRVPGATEWDSEQYRDLIQRLLAD